MMLGRHCDGMVVMDTEIAADVVVAVMLALVSAAAAVVQSLQAEALHSGRFQ